jgi:hypothetical protein
MTRMADLKNGDKFLYNQQEYLRIPDERLSCCKVFNAQSVATGEKIQVVPITEVEVIQSNNS